MSVLDAQIETVGRLEPRRVVGRVIALRGLTALVGDLPLPVGALVRIEGARDRADEPGGSSERLGEIVGFQDEAAIVMMLSGVGGITPRDRVIGLHSAPTIAVGESMLGRCLDGLGRPIDDGGPLFDTIPRLLEPEPIRALHRRRIMKPIHTGIRAIDLVSTLGQGQRIGIFAGPGVGKSTLIGSIARNATSDINVIGLIGERGREVRDFIESCLGSEGLKRSVLVIATSDESPLLRVRAAHAACAIAEHFRDEGKSVLLMMDSVTRFAHAQRQIGLSVGEPPATRGYTPSVFAAMARLLERAGALDDAGARSGGSVTGIYSILVEGDDMTEPVADAARGILDGHIMLSRSLAQRGHYPAIDVLDSVSRVADDVCDEAHLAARRQIVRLVAAYRDIEELVQVGAYASGSDPEADVAIRYREQINALLHQEPTEVEPFAEARSRMIKMAVEAGAMLQQVAKGSRR